MDHFSKWDRYAAQICANCPLCRHAREKQQGMAYQLVKRVESRVCPFCRAYARVYRRRAHEVVGATTANGPG